MPFIGGLVSMTNYSKTAAMPVLETRTISVDDLRIGMYVTKLDRPWVETPFLFQGFLVDSEDTRAELRHYCKHVHVDVQRSNPGVIDTRPTPERPRELIKPSGTRAAPATPTAGTDDDSALLKTEVINARNAHEKASLVVKSLFQSIRSGEDVEIEALEKTLDPMISSIMRNDDALSWLVRMQKTDDYVYSHSIASSVWSLVFGKHLGLDRTELLVLATGAMFIDVGKTKIRQELLIKRAPLEPQEIQEVRSHVEHGVAIVSEIDGLDPRVVEMVRHHHERHDGSGYPQGLKGTDIPVFARIVGLIDAYDAMITERPYAKPQSSYEATRQLGKLAGREFAAEVVEQFIQAIGVFPVGSLVELNTGEVGMVVAQNRVRRLRPKLILLLDRDKRPLDVFPIVDLRNETSTTVGQKQVWIERGLAPGAFGIDPTEYYLRDP